MCILQVYPRNRNCRAMGKEGVSQAGPWKYFSLELTFHFLVVQSERARFLIIYRGLLPLKVLIFEIKNSEHHRNPRS